MFVVVPDSPSPIDRFEMRYHLNPGLSDARKSEDWTQRFPATRAGFALALDTCDYMCIKLRGTYGDASALVYAIMGDGERCINTDEHGDDGAISESRACELLTTDGEIDAGDVHALRCSVWDGNNHQSFTPSRSLACLSGEDTYERNGHALIRWDENGCVDDFRVDEGWEVADEYWGTLGNEPWTYGNRDTDERKALLDDANIDYDIIWVSDDDVVLLVKTADVTRAQELMEAE